MPSAVKEVIEETGEVKATICDTDAEVVDNRPAPEPPISPPTDVSRRSSLGKRQRNLTYSKNDEDPGNSSPSSTKQRRSTYEVHPSDSFLHEETKQSSSSIIGPCDSTVRDERVGVAECNKEDVVMETDLMASQGDQEEEGNAAKDDILKLLEKRVLDRSKKLLRVCY